MPKSVKRDLNECKHGRPASYCTTCRYGQLKEPDEAHVIDLVEEINRNHARWNSNPRYFSKRGC